MTNEKLQGALLEWFWCDPERSRSMQQIDNRCAALYGQFFPQLPVKNAKYALFYPLLKYGFIEFYGEDKYALAPTCALQANGLLLVVNLPASLLSTLESVLQPLLITLGYALFPLSAVVLDFLKEHDVVPRPFHLATILRDLPQLPKVIAAWEKDLVIDPSHFLYFQNKWNNYPGDTRPGVYKKSGLAYAQRVCLLAAGEWRLVPPADKHVDAFYYAVLWSKTYCSNQLKANYFSRSSTLVLEDTFFPLLLERLLVINTLLQPQEKREIGQRHYHLGLQQFGLVNQFLNQSITVAYE